MLSARLRVRPLVLAGALCAILAACSSGNTATWTYAPPSASSAVSSGSPGAESSTGAGVAAAASDGASPVASAGASPSGAVAGSSAAATLALVAQNIQFDKSTLDATAGNPVRIEFDNEDQGIPHNLDVKDASGVSVGKTEIANGPTKQTLDLPALQPGSYQYACDVHPNMTGTLTVK